MSAQYLVFMRSTREDEVELTCSRHVFDEGLMEWVSVLPSSALP